MLSVPSSSSAPVAFTLSPAAATVSSPAIAWPAVSASLPSAAPQPCSWACGCTAGSSSGAGHASCLLAPGSAGACTRTASGRYLSLPSRRLCTSLRGRPQSAFLLKSNTSAIFPCRSAGTLIRSGTSLHSVQSASTRIPDTLSLFGTRQKPSKTHG